MKLRNWKEAVPTLNECLRLDPTNKTALYRRSKALSKPVNSGVDDFKQAVKDLKAINSKEVRVMRRIAKLEKKIKHNSKCEHDVYSKMFTRTANQPSIADIVAQSIPKMAPVKTTLDLEMESDIASIDAEVKRMQEKKREEFSFEVKPESEWTHFPEFQQL